MILLATSFFSWLYYKSHADKGYATYSIGICTKTVSTYDLTNGIYDKELIRMDEYAKLSDIVYRKDENEKLDTFLNWKKSLIQMEKLLPDKNKKKVNGLYYEIWELNEDANETIVAIVFRGTKPPSDWIANFRWIIKGIDKNIWDHYDQLSQINTAIVDSIKSNYSSNNKKLKIVSTGHSLGGGLAQFMAYSIPEINYVYAFDSSPVTGYYDVKPKSVRDENKKDAVIYRIYESGEGLTFARKFMTILYPVPLFKTKNPAIKRIRFSFKTGVSSVKQHSMKDLAASLRTCKINK